MAGNKNIYIVYDPTIEDNVSLSKFIGIILEKAKFPLGNIAPISTKDFILLLERSPEDIKNVICLNKTYSSVSIKLGSYLKEPTHKFFTRTYKDPVKGILLIGLMADIETIFTDDATKKKVWLQLQTYQKDYTEFSSGLREVVLQEDEVPPVIKSSADVIAEEKKEEIVEEQIVEVPKKIPVKKTTKTATPKSTTKEKDIIKEEKEEIVETTKQVVSTSRKTSLTVEELEDFYLKVNPILQGFFSLKDLVGGK